METDKVPLDKGTPRELLQKLGDNFGLDEGVVDALVQLGVENLQEFRFLWANEQAIETWVAKIGLGDKALLMTARVRRAWAAVGLYYRQVEQDRSKIALSDLDTMLGETELRDSKQAFWRRYRLRFPAEIHPSDSTISRVAREMQKRMLCIFNVWRVKSLQFQLTTSQKKRKLGDSLFFEDGEDDEIVAHDVDSYLDRLFTLLLAYAMAGCASVTGAPEATQELGLGADTTKFVNVPLDVVYKYFFRAKRSVASMPMQKRLQWLQDRDVEERSEWVSKFRESTIPLGQVIHEVYMSRDAHWNSPGTTTSEKPSAAPTAASTKSPTKTTTSPTKIALGKPINGKQVALNMKDGTKLCPHFQRGGCKAKPCPQGVHRCAHMLRKDRVCGAFSHGASTCNGKR